MLIFVSQWVVDRLMFHPPSTYRDNQEILKLKTANGKQISALYLPNPQAQYTLLYSHGNAEDIGTIYTHLLSLRNFGFSVLAYDYQGYGTSEGRPTEKNTYLDIEAAYQYLTQTLHIPPEHIILYGASIGSGPSIELALRKPIAGLILQSPFVSIFRVMTKWPLLPWDPFNNLEKIGLISKPILLMHGEQDNIVPVWHGRKLLKKIRLPAPPLFVEGAHHNDFVAVAGQRYWEAIRLFVESLRKHIKHM